MKQLVPTGLDEYLAEHKEGDIVTGRMIEVSEGRARVELGEGVLATCRMSESVQRSVTHKDKLNRIHLIVKNLICRRSVPCCRHYWKSGVPLPTRRSRKPGGDGQAADPQVSIVVRSGGKKKIIELACWSNADLPEQTLFCVDNCHPDFRAEPKGKDLHLVARPQGFLGLRALWMTCPSWR